LAQRAPQELFQRSERGAVFESLVVSELYKNFLHRGEQPGLYFWRDATGHEVDIVIDIGAGLIPIELKSAQTIASDFFDNLKYYQGLAGDEAPPASLVYGGSDAFRRSGMAVYPWYFL